MGSQVKISTQNLDKKPFSISKKGIFLGMMVVDLGVCPATIFVVLSRVVLTSFFL
jgi:hypothetical protein